MYNGIGLQTPRGSGTNGHVQRNWAVVRTHNKDKINYRTEEELAKLNAATSRQPNQDILDHERKRKVELKCVELEEILEEKGYNKEMIETKVDNYRKMLIGQDTTRLDISRDEWGRINVTETHQVAEAQQEKNAKLREAFGISEYFVDGSSFDPDRAAKEQLARAAANTDKDETKAPDGKRYELVRTPSPEPESVKAKKRKHKSKERGSSEDRKKKKKSKKHKKEKLDKAREKKKMKRHRYKSSSSSSDSDSDSSVEDEKRKKKKSKRKEKRRISKKKSYSTDSSRESSLEPQRKKQNVDKPPFVDHKRKGNDKRDNHHTENRNQDKSSSSDNKAKHCKKSKRSQSPKPRNSKHERNPKVCHVSRSRSQSRNRTETANVKEPEAPQIRKPKSPPKVKSASPPNKKSYSPEYVSFLPKVAPLPAQETPPIAPRNKSPERPKYIIEPEKKITPKTKSSIIIPNLTNLKLDKCDKSRDHKDKIKVPNCNNCMEDKKLTLPKPINVKNKYNLSVLMPVVRLRSSSEESDSDHSNYKVDEEQQKELHTLQLLKSDLAAKARDVLERKIPKIHTETKFETAIKKSPDQDTKFNFPKLNDKIFVENEPAVKVVSEAKEESKPKNESKPKDESKPKEETKPEGLDWNNLVDKISTDVQVQSERSVITNSPDKIKERKSCSSRSSYSSLNRSNSVSSYASSRSRFGSRSRSRSHTPSRSRSSRSYSGSSTSRSASRSPSIPRRHGSPSFLDRRRITSARKRPIPYHRPTPSSPSASSWTSNSNSPWYSRSPRRNRSGSRSSCRNNSSRSNTPAFGR